MSFITTQIIQHASLWGVGWMQLQIETWKVKHLSLHLHFSCAAGSNLSSSEIVEVWPKKKEPDIMFTYQFPKINTKQ